MEKGEILINTENIFPIIKKAVYSDHEIFLRELVSNGVDAISKRRILLMFKDSYLLEKGMNEQKEQQKRGNMAILHLNPCDDLAKADQIMKENNCSEIFWVK